ncbi:MAG TPA: transposase, partial [Fodinibius sp.]|nr:transposase [Fodinibius sp.]
MPTVCKEDNHLKLEFQQADGRRVVADFGGGDITSDGGSLLVRQVASRSNMLADFADCFTDHRDTERTDHSIE